MSSDTFAIDPERTDRLAEVAVRVGLDLQPGQELILAAPLTAVPLVRRIVEHAYRAGAGPVTTLYADAAATLARYRHAKGGTFDRSPGWLFEGQAKAMDEGAARLAVFGDDPAMLADQDPERIDQASRSYAAAADPVFSRIARFETNWTVLAYPSGAWAGRVFPDLPEDAALASLADAIFAACRVDGPDPVAAWAEHSRQLHARCDWLNARRFDALHFAGPGTDLTVGLADGHVWTGGAATARNGITCIPNIPTEEVSTVPHSERVEGVVRSTRPLSHNGTVIEGIEMAFEAGRAVRVSARSGADVLRAALAADEGAGRLGEVALVPDGSPISRSGLLFYKTLFDENAACHLAMGRCYPGNVGGGGEMDEAALARAGGNHSLIHIDWMIGSGEIDIDGLAPIGDRAPVFRKGEWAA